MRLDPLHWEIPSAIDLESYLNQHPPNFKYKIDHFYYIIEYLALGMEKDDIDKNRGYVNVNATKLQSRIHSYKQYLDHLLKHNFIITDGIYITGQKSRGYLINGYSSKEPTEVQSIPIKDNVVKKNRNKIIQEYNKKICETEKKYNHLTKWFNKNLKIDYKQAVNEIPKLYPPYPRLIGGPKWYEASRTTKMMIASMSVYKFFKQHFYYQVDENVTRFHSNLTNIKKELRNHITYNGNKLVNIDIKNSQPLFSLILFQPEFYNPKSLHNIHSYSHIFNSIPSLTSNSFSLMLEEFLKTSNRQAFKEYSDMVNSGEFYKCLFNKMYPKTNYDKKRVKTMVFTVFFSDNRFIGQRKAIPKKDFKKTFPEVYKVFSLIKKKDKRILARILQSIESNVIINKVTKRISIENPKLPIFTIHDSVITINGYEDYVASVIKEEVKNLTGLDVKLGYEYWG